MFFLERLLRGGRRRIELFRCFDVETLFFEMIFVGVLPLFCMAI